MHENRENSVSNKTRTVHSERWAEGNLPFRPDPKRYPAAEFYRFDSKEEWEKWMTWCDRKPKSSFWYRTRGWDRWHGHHRDMTNRIRYKAMNVLDDGKGFIFVSLAVSAGLGIVALPLGLFFPTALAPAAVAAAPAIIGLAVWGIGQGLVVRSIRHHIYRRVNARIQDQRSRMEKREHDILTLDSAIDAPLPKGWGRGSVRSKQSEIS